jgi:dolichol-phosphate mannosyltransferase
MNARVPALYLVVPLFNEEENLVRLFASFRLVQANFGQSFDIRFVLVDDGSTDATSVRAVELAEGLSVKLISNRVNQGPGAAFGHAFAYLASCVTDADWVLTLEGDNTSRRELIGQMLRRADEGYDVVLASPYMYGGGITNTSPMRVFLSHMANAFVKELLGVHGILTMSSFFRLHRGSTLLRLQQVYGPNIVERRGFECMVEMLLKMMYLGTPISEVPMLLDTALRAGKSKMKVMRTIRGYLSLSRRSAAWRRAAVRRAPAVVVAPALTD